MTNRTVLPIIGASLIASIAVGIHLGEGAIGMINPIYFQGPALHPRDRGVALDEPLPGPARPTHAQLYGWTEGAAARAEDCGDCEALQARDAFAYSAVVPYFGGPDEPRRAAAVRQEVIVHRLSAEPAVAAEPVKNDLDRYAYYPVEEEAVEAPLEAPKPVFD